MKPFYSVNHPHGARFLRAMFLAAAIYNVFWGIVVIFFPLGFFQLFNLEPLNYPFLMSGIGMFVAVYGYGYFVVSRDLLRYPQLVVVGLMGKTLGPIGWMWNVWLGAIPAKTLWLNVFNDFIWLPGFIYYLIWLRQNAEFSYKYCTRSNLYSNLLGKYFTKLPTQLRKFHQKEGIACAKGKFDIILGKGILRKLIVWFACLPKAGKGVEVILKVLPTNLGKEKWIRTFNGQRFVTDQHNENDILKESHGLMTFTFIAQPTERGYQLVSRSAQLLGIPLPKKISPRVDASVRGTAKGWQVQVNFYFPIVGLTYTYKGEMIPS